MPEIDKRLLQHVVDSNDHMYTIVASHWAMLIQKQVYIIKVLMQPMAGWESGLLEKLIIKSTSGNFFFYFFIFLYLFIYLYLFLNHQFI